MTGKEKLEYLQQQLSYFKKKAESDLLTGLYNRISFENYVNSQIEKNKNGYFILIDVDKFKEINDQYGHLAGDEVLIEIGKSLRRIFPETAVIGRLGGDEFAVYSLHEAVDLLEEKIRNIEDEIEKRAGKVCKGHKVKCSMGIAEIKEGEKFKDIYKKSDAAMYVAKRTDQVFCWHKIKTL